MGLMQDLNENQLNLKVREEKGTLRVAWQGKSNDRNPAVYLNPFFEELAKNALSHSKKIEMDFSELQYMNSSTITPVVQLLDRAREEGLEVSLLYDKNKSWQEISFTAMSIFESDLIKISPI